MSSLANHCDGVGARLASCEYNRNRCLYLDEVFAIIPVERFTREMGVLAATVDAEMKKTGLMIATTDLLIGVTALQYDYAIGTCNVRHFQMIPGLKVLTL